MIRSPAALRAQWLGQAGFLLQIAGGRHGTRHVLLDPYLSDSLAHKYAGKKFPHDRLLRAPVAIADLPAIDVVLCSHSHTDHMDPDTLRPLLAAQPTCRLLVPLGERDEALLRSGVEADRVDALVAGECVQLPVGTVVAVASAHEEREFDGSGHDRFLGYVLGVGGLRVYHSGDCIPYHGLAETLRRLKIDVAFLPVNGRDEYRRSNGVPGNFTFAEAMELCAAAKIPALVPHHWGMFDFNTVDVSSLTATGSSTNGVHVGLPEHGGWMDLISLVACGRGAGIPGDAR
jgi:L-ascorbate metabolism protein UlaG (beta-lactamase superfamily)